MGAQVGQVQREFIQRLLTFTTFSKHMAAVRETHSLLRCALDLRDRPRPPEPSDGGRCIKVREGRFWVQLQVWLNHVLDVRDRPRLCTYTRSEQR